MSNTIFVHKVVEAYRTLQNARGLFDGTVRRYVHKSIAVYKREKDLNEAGMTNEECLMLTKAVEAARGYVQSPDRN